jgi:Site-specific recombinase XerD
MKEQLTTEITRQMLPYLDNAQMEQLLEVLSHCFWGVQITPDLDAVQLKEKETNAELLEMFISAKRVEGCSEKTLKYYKATLVRLFDVMDMHVTHMKTDDLRNYLSDYQQTSQCTKANIDNIRRILSSFFAWLEDENYIIKSPVRRIHKIKSSKVVKETYSDESMEIIRDQCGCLRDLALIDLLASTGMRVGELVRLNRDDIDFENRECVVFGKGSKERPVYFDARTKIHLKNYLDSRIDDEDALFVSLLFPHKRLEISGVEIRLRELGRKLGITKVHPHKFRRTLATRAIDKGMPIEQVQRLLGHAKIDTTMQYAMVNQNNVKISHRKYIG